MLTTYTNITSPYLFVKGNTQLFSTLHERVLIAANHLQKPSIPTFVIKKSSKCFVTLR
nr:MAG TPA: hypothetical protein [Caudoviricetes sp.]